MKRAPWERYMPRRMRLPYGYEVRFHAVSPSYMKKIQAGNGACWSLAFNFGERVPGRTRPPAKLAAIYFSREMNIVQFLDKLQHEMHHTITEWGGHVFNTLYTGRP